MLTEKGHKVIPVGRRKGTSAGIEIENNPEVLLDQPVDTITLYINPMIQEDYKDLVMKVHPKRVIFNPGTENPEWAKELEQKGIVAEVACTLVLLTTNQFLDY